MKFAKIIIFLLLAMLMETIAQTTLSKGDIAIIGINTGTDDFSFVLLTDITSGTVVKFTDAGWFSGAFYANEGAIEYTAPSALSAGTVINHSNSSANFSNTNDGYFSISTGLTLSPLGDQLIIYQGNASSPTLLHAINTNNNSSNWEGGGATESSTDSELPTGLTNGTDCLAIGAGPNDGDENDAGVYSGATNLSPAATFTAINNLSNWTLTLSGDATMPTSDFILPVEMTSFYSVLTINSVKLKWETATEVNNYGFEVERKEIGESSKETEWQKIGFVEGHGNSNSPKKYIFEDKTYTAGKVYKYRLKQIDFDGAFDHSDELVVETTVPEKAELAQNYPNPFNPSTTIKFSMPEADFAKLTVYNSIGQEVSVLINENLEPGFYTYLFDGSKLASGAYVYKLETAGRVITKKMLLIK